MTNQCQNWSRKKALKLSKIMFFQMVKSYKSIVKTMVFEGLTGCLREQGFHQQYIKNKSKIHPEINVKSIGIRVRKMDVQNNGKASKMDSKR